jgi:hypothetical protein
VLGYRQPRRAGDPVTVVGTVMAPSRAAAAPLARSLVRARGRALSPPITAAWAARWWVASACRRGWLLEALANDGAKLRGVG